MKLFSAKQLIPIYIPLFLLFLLYSSSHSLTRISANQPLKDGDVLLSKGAIFALGFFNPSNNSKNRYVGIWYNNVPIQTVVWVANRGNPLSDTSGVFSINIHGNLILNHTNRNLNPIWSSNVSVSSCFNSFAELLDTGNLVLRDGGGRRKVLWQSFDFPCDTMLPFAKLGLDRNIGLDRILTSWKSLDDPSSGSVTMRIDPTGYPQAFIHKSGDPFWRLGSWTGQGWSGIPVMIKPDPLFYVVFINNANEVTVMNGVKILKDPSISIRMVLDETGRVTRTIWQAQENRWLEVWYGPAEDCDRFRRCGSNSICDPYSSQKFECVCLPGFQHKNMRDRSSGCERNKNTSTCRSGEGFVKVASVKVPKTSKAQVDNNTRMSLNGCRERCLKDCSCTAYTSLDETTQRGCLTWHNDDLEDIRAFNGGGQDLYVRVDSLELAKYERKPYGSLGKKGLVTLIVLSIFLFIFVAASFLYWFVWKPRHAKETHSNYVLDRESNSDLVLFDLSDITEATNNFSIANKIGQGGFGFVYKGLLNNGMEIAVKKLSKYSEQSIEEFKNEVAIIAKLQHRNLVKILGYCIQGEDNMLIYEYLPNKSLDSFIFDQAKKLQLDWRKRFNIICGIARGILYLHQDSRVRIIHKDLKASNILLDYALNPKITDFGVAQILRGDQIEASTNHIVGTYGYMSPEYAMEGLFSIKSDVYSFGVLLLEIVTGKKNSGHYDDITSTLVKHIWDLWREGSAMEIIDPSLKCETCLEHEVLKCIHIGLLCVQEHASDRPTMLEVVSMLENDSTALHPPKQPAFVLKKTTCDHSNQSIGEEVNSLNEMSTTVIEAR